MTLTTLLILAVCRTRIMHELQSGPGPPQTLRGSAVEHRRAESEDLRSDCHGDSEFFLVPRSWRDEKKIITLFL